MRRGFLSCDLGCQLFPSLRGRGQASPSLLGKADLGQDPRGGVGLEAGKLRHLVRGPSSEGCRG